MWLIAFPSIPGLVLSGNPQDSPQSSGMYPHRTAKIGWHISQYSVLGLARNPQESPGILQEYMGDNKALRVQFNNIVVFLYYIIITTIVYWNSIGLLLAVCWTSIGACRSFTVDWGWWFALSPSEKSIEPKGPTRNAQTSIRNSLENCSG